MDRGEIKSGSTYRSDSGRRYRVDLLVGQKVTAASLDEPLEPEIETSLGRFASRMRSTVE